MANTCLADGFSCLPLTTQLSDPIVTPGRESSHMHVVTGGTAFQRTMGMQTAWNARETTCEVALDRSNYWIAIIGFRRFTTRPRQNRLRRWNISGVNVLADDDDGQAVYYLNRACTYSSGARACPDRMYPLAPPAGVRVVAGNSMLQTYNDSDYAQRAISHMCIGKSRISNETKHLPHQPCEKLSPDHKSHVCPASHPIAIFSVFVEFIFNTEPFADYQNLLYATGDRTGYGLHGDFINGWTDQVALHSAFETCTGKGWLQNPGCSITKTQTRPVAPLSLEAEASLSWAELGQNRAIPVLPGHPEHAY
ncbi:hypothetical protein BDW68DRAFT_194284 [Aspergillus falconensis]